MCRTDHLLALDYEDAGGDPENARPEGHAFFIFFITKEEPDEEPEPPKKRKPPSCGPGNARKALISPPIHLPPRPWGTLTPHGSSSGPIGPHRCPERPPGPPRSSWTRVRGFRRFTNAPDGLGQDD